MILSKPDILTEIRAGNLTIEPLTADKALFNGMSYGLSRSSYDVRIAQDITLYPVTLWNLILNTIGIKRPSFSLASIVEKLEIPNTLGVEVSDKSTWIREGLSVHNTYIEPGWKGYLTVELACIGSKKLVIPAGTPIAQLKFEKLSSPTESYDGKYQNQKDGPQGAIFEVEK